MIHVIGKSLNRLPPKWLVQSILLGFVLIFPGCRRAAPPSFSSGEELLKLTEDLEDEEEIVLYKDLQNQVVNVLLRHTGSPEKPLLLGQLEPSEPEKARLNRGYQLYSKYCVQCHGVNGDGNGSVAKHLNPKPRNYTHGIFKFTSTPYGRKPRRADLILTIRRGVTGTSMPSFDRFSKEDMEAVIDYVLVLTYRGELERTLASIAFEDEELPDEEGIEEVIEDVLLPWRESMNELVMPETMMPPMTEKSVLAGHQLFLKHACNKCHGRFGRGGSVGNVEVGADAWGNKAAAADLSSGMFHGGGRPIDIYRRIHSGINGTPMPAFKDLFAKDPDEIWQLVHFIKQTSNRRRLGLEPLSEADLPPGFGTDIPAKSDDADSPVEETEASEEESSDDEEAEEEVADEPETESEAESNAEEASDETEDVTGETKEEAGEDVPAGKEPANEETEGSEAS